jgi:hypothetical protein
MWRIIIGASLVFTVPAGAQAPTAPPSPDSLRGIRARGVLLAQYDYASWHASDAVMELRPSGEQVQGYLARRDGPVWVVAFGRLTADQSAFLIAYEARQASTRPDSFGVSVLRPPRVDTGYFARAARALEIARKDFGQVSRPYNAAVLPTGDGDWWVYLYPAQTRPDVWPHGGDVRYRVHADGRAIAAKRQLHKAVMEFAASPNAGALKAGMQASVLDDVPEDTDVFHVLVRGPRVPQFIVTNAFVYQIAPDGVIKIMGRREEILGK